MFDRICESDERKVPEDIDLLAETWFENSKLRLHILILNYKIFYERIRTQELKF